MKRIKNLAILTAALLAAARTPAAETILFQDNFDTDTSANWIVAEGSENATPDYTVNWFHDYSTNRYTSNSIAFNIPPAPNSGGTTRGVKFSVNKNDDVAAAAAVSVFPKDQTFTGNYALRFDMWINYNGGEYGGTGSTEFGTFGINHAGTNVAWPAPGGVQTSSEGTWFAVTGEAGAARDFRAYEGDPSSTALPLNQGGSGGFLDLDGNGTVDDEVIDVETDGAFYPYNLIFPRPPFETTGVPGKRWVQVEVRQSSSKITWLMNGYTISERDNQSVWTAGNIILGTMDIFASVANPKGDNYVIFDNVRVVDLGAEPVLLPKVSVAATNPSAAEPATAGSVTISRMGDTANALSIRIGVVGTATAGADFAAIPLTTNIPAGAASIEIPITVLDDQRSESTEQAKIYIIADPSYEVFAPMLATVDISDDADVTTVTLTVVDENAFKNLGDSAVVRLTRSGDTTADLTVNITVAGTATAGQHYNDLGTSLVIPAGAASATFAIIPSATLDTNRTVSISLAAGAGYVLGTPRDATLNLRADPITTVLTENFDVETGAQWNINMPHAGSSSAEFNWDYSAFAIPSAPNSTGGTTRGLRMQANIGTAPTQTGVSVSPKNLNLTGNYRVSFDFWINYNGPLALGGSGSTMALSGGIATTGTRPEVPGNSVDSVLFGLTGDGGAGNTAGDFRAYTFSGNALNPLQPSSGVYAAGTQASALNNLDSYYAQFGGAAAPEGQLNQYPEQTEATSAGAPGMAWHRFVIVKEGTNVTWSVDGLRIATVTTSNREISTNIFLGFFDINSGQTTGNKALQFGLVDNLLVERLESGTATGEITLTGVARTGNNFQIAFTAPDAMQSFVVEGSPTVDGDYEAEANVQFELISSAGGLTTRRATLSMSTPNRFFLIRQQ